MAAPSDQAALYRACVPKENHWKLTKEIDFEHNGVPKHLGEISNAMDEWEGDISTKLGLTKVDVASVKNKHPDNLNLQA